MLTAKYTGQFARDLKRLAKKHIDLNPLKEAVNLVLEDTNGSKEELKRHRNMYQLHGSWADSNECHIANAGDWLLVWRTGNGLAVFQRTGSHDELFG
ncbi:type II toxin-antitoxin system YafQ family toxin [Curtanaerobium respiraculi]|uniref:type II toxin-antitoxin system YafQ family toxin n=1 Tax=Curtanaerobium respiraculi TaxID=2949669 RepID=UPI0024B3AFC9|nr:type II toxin-antitoxin system YafQ family toxin [Curtanaerobium respiraculi]